MHVVVCVKKGMVTSVYATGDAGVTVIDLDSKDEHEIAIKDMELVKKSKEYRKVYEA